MPSRTGSKRNKAGRNLMALVSKVKTDIDGILSAATAKIDKKLYDLECDIAAHYGILTARDLTDFNEYTEEERKKYDEEMTDE